VCSGDYRVNFRDGSETTAYYTDNLEDAVNTAVEMARKRALRAVSCRRMRTLSCSPAAPSQEESKRDRR
jgi:hypothetical protein